MAPQTVVHSGLVLDCDEKAQDEKNDLKYPDVFE